MTKPTKQQQTNGLDDQFLSVLQEPYPAAKKAELKVSLFDAPAPKWWQKPFALFSLNLTLNLNRSPFMLNNKLRPVMLGLFAMMTVFALAFAISPDVRATIARLTVLDPFVDGVEIDPDQSGKLTIVQKVGADIVNEDTFSFDAEALEPVSDDDMVEKYGDFVLPTTVPDGYTFEPPVQRMTGPDILVARWGNDTGNEIVYYYWGHSDFYSPDSDDVIWFESDEGAYNNANYGVEASITTTDMSLTEADLDAMMP